MRSFDTNILGIESSWEDTSTGTYIFYDDSTKKLSLSRTVLADTTHGEFVYPKGFFGSGNRGGIPPHPKTRNRVEKFLGLTDEIRVVGYVVRQYEREFNVSRTYQRWSNTIPGPVYVSHRNGDENEVFQPK